MMFNFNLLIFIYKSNTSNSIWLQLSHVECKIEKNLVMENMTKMDIWIDYGTGIYCKDRYDFLLLSTLTEQNAKYPFFCCQNANNQFLLKRTEEKQVSSAGGFVASICTVDECVPVWKNLQQPLLLKQKAVRRPRKIPPL